MDQYYNTKDSQREWANQDPLFKVSQIGATHAIESPNAIEAIRSDIFRGAGNLEISANGAGRSSQGMTGVTFEAIDNTQREAIRELARINDVNLTTHATFQAGNLSGLGQEGFSEQQRKVNMDEIKKAIDFSAEAANGGSVVVHTGEFPRPIGVSKDMGGFGEGEFQFETHEKETEEALYSLVDVKSGQIQRFKANTTVFRPEIEMDDKGKPKYLRDQHGNPMIDDVLKKDLEIQYRNKHGRNVAFEDLPEDVQKDAFIKIYKTDEDGNIQINDITLNGFIEEKKKEGETNTGKILKEFFKEQAYGQIDSALGQARYYEESYQKGLHDLKETKDQLKYYQQMKDQMSEEKWKDFSNTMKNSQEGRFLQNFSRKDDILDMFEDKLAHEQRQILHGREAGIGGRKQAFQLLESINNTSTMEDYALKKTEDSIAELGEYAITEYENARRMRPNDKLKPIQLTLENIFPENGYGSHPEELAQIVKIGRKALKNRLMQNNRYGESEAKKLAEQTVGVTLDTGHLNMWRKYFKPKDGENKKQTDKRFKKWYVKQVDKLAKAGVIGNMHIADNLGWDDSHLAAGQGNAPIREILEVLNKYGYDDVVTSEGGFGYTENPKGELGLLETWKMAGAGMFNNYHGRPIGSDSWTSPGSRMYSVHQGHLGAANKPNFMFKGYSPESEDWTPWSGQGME